MKTDFSFLRPLSNFNCLLTFESTVKRMLKTTCCFPDWQAKSIHKIWYCMIFHDILLSLWKEAPDEVAVVRWPAPYTNERKHYWSSNSSFILGTGVTLAVCPLNSACIMVVIYQIYPKEFSDLPGWLLWADYINFRLISYWPWDNPKHTSGLTRAHCMYNGWNDQLLTHYSWIN